MRVLDCSTLHCCYWFSHGLSLLSLPHRDVCTEGQKRHGPQNFAGLAGSIFHTLEWRAQLMYRYSNELIKTKYKLTASRRWVCHYKSTVCDHIFKMFSITLTFWPMTLKILSTCGPTKGNICVIFGSNPFSGSGAIEFIRFLWQSLAYLDLWTSDLHEAGMVRVWVAGKTVWSHCYTRAISECFSAYNKALYKFICLQCHQCHVDLIMINQLH